MKQTNNNTSSERISRTEKEANDFQWYKDKINMYDTEAGFYSTGYGGVSEFKRMKVNYDLFNNVMDLSDFAYVCSPYGSEVGELPADMVNRDISSYRVKAMLGMEMRRPFGYRIIAVNKEATQRREEEETKKITQYVVDSIMAPIRQQTEMQYQEQLQNKELAPEEKQKIVAQMEAQIEANTPERVRMYMKRDHQDPAEVQGQQITNYLIQKQEVRKKFNKGWKHACISAYEVYWMGIINGEPTLKVINPVRFSCDKSSDIDYIEDGEWAAAEFRMHPSEVIRMFKLTDDEIDTIWENHNRTSLNRIQNNMFSFEEYVNTEDENTVRVLHVAFKGLRKIGWLDYIDQDGVLQTKTMVDESYTLNKKNGDVSITWEWIPENYEGYKIGADIFKEMKPIEGQFKDLDNIYLGNKLPYYGAIYDNMNSQPTSIMDRMKVYQYYYNIVMYRLELLLASDKGKKVLMNINAIPSESGIDIKKWQYYVDSSPYMWYNPDEEGMNQSDVNTIAKVIDLSLASDINKYIELAEYLEQKCGKSVGITDPVLGQTAVSERVANNQQNLVQTSHMLEPYFDLHNSVKKNVLQGLLSLAKVAYVGSDKKYLTYVLDDMSLEMLKLDLNLLDESTLGLFMEDSSMSEEIKQTINNLAHAAMQNQKIELSDVLKVIKQDSIQEAEEALLTSEELREGRVREAEEANRKHELEKLDKIEQSAETAHEREKEIVVLKESERRKTVIQAQTILSLGFNEDKDVDGDGVVDVMEVAKEGINAQLAISKENRENRKQEHDMQMDKERNKLEEKKITAMNNKPTNK